MSGANMREYTASTAVTSDRTGEEDGAKADYRSWLFPQPYPQGRGSLSTALSTGSGVPIAGRRAASGSQSSGCLLLKYCDYQS